MLPLLVKKCGNLIIQHKTKVFQLIHAKDLEDMDLECFRGGGSKVLYFTFIYSFLLPDLIIFT